ncbi:MAG: DegT/DnrJ/EryC1/StrS family aminotransferase [Abditibacteriaceae bacterium]
MKNEILAIDGGAPSRDKPFHAWPIYDEREERALLRALHSGVWGMGGEETAQFESEFARAVGAKYAFAVPTGTAALETAIFAAGIGYGDEVIVPPYTFVATAHALLLRGALPVFADIDSRTLNLDPHDVESKITTRTRAIMPVHIGGCPASMDAIIKIARKHDLRVIEDAAQAHGAQWNNRPVGAIGDLGGFSFQSSKNINCGEGGVVVTNDDELAERCESFHNYGRTRGGMWYQHDKIGTNFRMTQFQAAILRAQLERMEDWAGRRQENGDYLFDELRELGLAPQEREIGVSRHAYHVLIVRYKSEAFGGWPREQFMEALCAEGVPTARGYFPLYRSKGVQTGTRDLVRFTGEEKFVAPHCPVADQFCDHDAMWLCGQSALLGTREDMDDILHAVSKIQRAARKSPLKSSAHHN